MQLAQPICGESLTGVEQRHSEKESARKLALKIKG